MSFTNFRGSLLRDGGAVTTGGMNIAELVGSTGILNVGAVGNVAAGVGTLTATMLAFGAGNGTLNFNHIDTSGTHAFSVPMSGAGTLNHVAGYTTANGVSSDTSVGNRSHSVHVIG